jgi:hypothetical protein
MGRAAVVEAPYSQQGRDPAPIIDEWFVDDIREGLPSMGRAMPSSMTVGDPLLAGGTPDHWSHGTGGPPFSGTSTTWGARARTWIR